MFTVNLRSSSENKPAMLITTSIQVLLGQSNMHLCCTRHFPVSSYKPVSPDTINFTSRSSVCVLHYKKAGQSFNAVLEYCICLLYRIETMNRNLVSTMIWFFSLRWLTNVETHATGLCFVLIFLVSVWVCLHHSCQDIYRYRPHFQGWLCPVYSLKGSATFAWAE